MARPIKFRGTRAEKEEWAFFLNEHGNIEYNKLCKKCNKDCKQSFRVTVHVCPLYERNK